MKPIARSERPNFLLYAGTGAEEITSQMGVYLRDRYEDDFIGRIELRNFKDGEISVKFPESFRGLKVVFVKSLCAPADSIWETLLVADAARRGSCDEFIGAFPYFGYGQQDRKSEPGVPISAKVLANVFQMNGVDRVITMDLHAPQIQGFFDIPVDHLYSSFIFVPKIQSMNLENLLFVSPDAGANKLARFYATRFGTQYIRLDKWHPKPNVTEILHVEGDENGRNPLVEGRTIVIVDDMINTGGTLAGAANALAERKAAAVYAATPHLLLAGEANRLIDESALVKVFGTNSISAQRDMSKKIEVLPLGEFFGEAALRAAYRLSINKLYADPNETKR